MLLGFKRRFATYVWEGSKTHTIRGFRKNPPKVGETCHCYVDPRQKTMALLGRWECVKVEPINIYECGDGRFGIVVARIELTPDEKDALAWRDGFRSYHPQITGAFVEMMRFWTEEHGDGRRIDVSRANFRQGEPIAAVPPRYGKPLQFEGHVIHWKYTEVARATRLPGVARAA